MQRKTILNQVDCRRGSRLRPHTYGYAHLLFGHTMLNRILSIALAITLSLPSLLLAEATVVVEHRAEGRATTEFRFAEIPSPVQGDAGERGQWSVVAGTADPAGGGLQKLNDGQLPRFSDQPRENFFFAPATDGGRVLLRLEHSIDIGAIRSYSWHPGERSPQVYTVYGSDRQEGDARGRQVEDGGVDLRPSATTDPATCGWTKIASIDTRQKASGQSIVDRRLRPSEGNSVDRRLRPSEGNQSPPPGNQTRGGQVAVEISAGTESERSLGRYRYLLFDIKSTQPNARFANTFFSEIDVLQPDAQVTLAVPAVTPGIETYMIEDGKYEFVMDTSECPDLTRWADQELAPIVRQWYPKIIELLPSDGYEPPQKFRIRISASMDGVAATGGTQVTCSANWYRRNLQGEAKGATVHELVHVVQQYGSARRNNPHAMPTPGWVVEGIADYVRWHLYEPASVGGGVAGRRTASLKYDASYRDTAAFLAWVIANDNPDLLRRLNAAARKGTYSDTFWKETTGKTAAELAAAWHADLDH